MAIFQENSFGVRAVPILDICSIGPGGVYFRGVIIPPGLQEIVTPPPVGCHPPVGFAVRLLFMLQSPLETELKLNSNSMPPSWLAGPLPPLWGPLWRKRRLVSSCLS